MAILVQFVYDARRYVRIEYRCRRGARTAQKTFRDRLPAGRRQRRACRRLPHARPAATRKTPARSYNGKRLGAHVISESESVTHFPAIQVYVSARSRGCATARAGRRGGRGGGGRPTDPLARGAAAGQGCREHSLCLRSHNKCRSVSVTTSTLLLLTTFCRRRR